MKGSVLESLLPDYIKFGNSGELCFYYQDSSIRNDLSWMLTVFMAIKNTRVGDVKTWLASLKKPTPYARTTLSPNNYMQTLYYLKRAGQQKMYGEKKKQRGGSPLPSNSDMVVQALVANVPEYLSTLRKQLKTFDSSCMASRPPSLHFSRLAIYIDRLWGIQSLPLEHICLVRCLSSIISQEGWDLGNESSFAEFVELFNQIEARAVISCSEKVYVLDNMDNLLPKFVSVVRVPAEMIDFLLGAGAYDYLKAFKNQEMPLINQPASSSLVEQPSAEVLDLAVLLHTEKGEQVLILLARQAPEMFQPILRGLSAESLWHATSWMDGKGLCLIDRLSESGLKVLIEVGNPLFFENIARLRSPDNTTVMQRISKNKRLWPLFVTQLTWKSALLPARQCDALLSWYLQPDFLIEFEQLLRRMKDHDLVTFSTYKDPTGNVVIKQILLHRPLAAISLLNHLEPGTLVKLLTTSFQANLCPLGFMMERSKFQAYLKDLVQDEGLINALLMQEGSAILVAKLLCYLPPEDFIARVNALNPIDCRRIALSVDSSLRSGASIIAEKMSPDASQVFQKRVGDPAQTVIARAWCNYWKKKSATEKRPREEQSVPQSSGSVKSGRFH